MVKTGRYDSRPTTVRLTAYAKAAAVRRSMRSKRLAKAEAGRYDSRPSAIVPPTQGGRARQSAFAPGLKALRRDLDVRLRAAGWLARFGETST